jgi:hypothetical protein
MQRAEKNIEEILEDLNRTFRRVRQESIDEELFDVISLRGADGRWAPRLKDLMCNVSNNIQASYISDRPGHS